MKKFSRNGISLCAKCPLRDRPRVWGEYPSEGKPQMLLIGESPGAEESEQKRPFVGPAGGFLNHVLYEAEVNRKRLWITNLLSCRPPENALTSFEGEEALRCCEPGFKAELAAAKKAGIHVVVPLGTKPTNALGIAEGITRARGSVYEKNGQVVLPTFHPSFILRGARKEESTWIGDFIKARDISKNGWQPPRERFDLFPSLSSLQAFTEVALKSKSPVAVDLETTGLSPDSGRIVVIGLGLPDRVIVVPMLKRTGLAYWPPSEYNAVLAFLRRIFSSKELVFQNAPFDVAWLMKNGFAIGRTPHDVLLAHHCLAGDTIINTLKGPIPIRELSGQENFWVFSHDGKDLVPRKAKICWKSGYRSDLVRVVFWSKGVSDKSHLFIDCTPEHEFPVQGKGKIRADALQPGDRLFRGQRSLTTVGLNKKIADWVFEKTRSGKKKSWNHIHHIDRNHSNNEPDNLQEVSITEHNHLHPENQTNATQRMQEVRRLEVEAMKCKDDIHHLYYKVGLSYREVAVQLNLSEHQVARIFRVLRWKKRSKSEATRLRWQKARNCRVVSVVPLRGEYDVYDMEVPGTHTFSANGVIVGNCLHPELPHNLGYIVSVYGTTPFWKGEMLDREEKILAVEDEVLRRYNARDVAVLHEVLPGLLADLDELKLRHIYEDIARKMILPVVEMNLTGLLVDKKALEKWKRSLGVRKANLDVKIRELCSLHEAFSLSSDEDLRLLIYGVKAPKFLRAEEKILEYETNTKLRRDTKKYRALQALAGVAESTHPLYVPQSTVRSTDSGKASVSAEALLARKIACNNRLVAIKGLKQKDASAERREVEKALAFFTLLTEFNEVDKLHSTYTRFPLWADGRCHPSYLVHGTKTGRLSSKGPNAQNIPESARHIFIARPGCVFAGPDYSNLELRVIANEAGDTSMLKTFAAGKSVHDENTKDLFGIGEKDPLWKDARYAQKKYIFGRKCYGGTLRGVYEKVVLEVPKLELTFGAFVRADERFDKKHPELAAWGKRQANLGLTERRVTNAFGRVRILLGDDSEVEREALNTPIQGTAADIANLALIGIYEELHAKNMKARLVAQVHDQIMVECPKSELSAVKKIMKKHMEAKHKLWGREVSFPIEFKVGSNWGLMKETK